MGGVIKVIGFDHLVLRCADVETTLAWYLDVLGLAGVRVEEWRRGEAPFPSIRIDATSIIDLIPVEVAGGGAPSGAEPPRVRNLDHLCLVVEPGVVDAVAASPGELRVVDGPARRFGARGTGWSIYVLDPDDTMVELRSY